MITYLSTKSGVENSYDLEEFYFTLMMIPLTILVDLVFIIFQPIFYLIYKWWRKERDRKYENKNCRDN